jgi:hypothetical protein
MGNSAHVGWGGGDRWVILPMLAGKEGGDIWVILPMLAWEEGVIYG